MLTTFVWIWQMFSEPFVFLFLPHTFHMPKLFSNSHFPPERCILFNKLKRPKIWFLTRSEGVIRFLIFLTRGGIGGLPSPLTASCLTDQVNNLFSVSCIPKLVLWKMVTYFLRWGILVVLVHSASTLDNEKSTVSSKSEAMVWSLNIVDIWVKCKQQFIGEPLKDRWWCSSGLLHNKK